MSATTVAASSALSLAGCSSSDDGNGNGGSGNGDSPTPTPEGTQLSDIVKITSHEWRGSSILEVAVQNQTEDTLDIVQVEANLYDGDTRIGHSYTNISSLAAGVKQTSDIRFLDLDAAPCEAATQYDLVPNFYYDSEDYEERYEYEYNPEFCR
jgi:hypothetical protein